MLHVRVQQGSEQRQQEESHVVNELQNLSVNRSNATSRNSLGTWRESLTTFVSAVSDRFVCLY
jgi:hypothetical protein